MNQKELKTDLISKDSYYDLGSRTDIYVSNSLMTQINPNQGGSVTKFWDFLEGKRELKETTYLNYGRLFHSYKEEPENFVVEPDNKPGEVLQDWTEATFEARKTCMDMEEFESTALYCRDGRYGHYKNPEALSKLMREMYPYYQFLQKSDGKFMLTQDEKDTLSALINADKTHNFAVELEGDIQKDPDILRYTEIGIIFKFEGMPCKILIDELIINKKKKSITIRDYKTISSPVSKFIGYLAFVPNKELNDVHQQMMSGPFFTRHIYRQLAFYSIGAVAFAGDIVHEDIRQYSVHCVVTAYETKPPYDIKDFPIPHTFIRAGISEASYLISNHIKPIL